MVQEALSLEESKRADAVKRGRALEYFTLSWNLLEAAIAVGAGAIAGSAALIGFGFDSLIECASGAALLWRLRDGEKGEARERTTLKLVGASFLLLAAYVAFDAGKTLIMREPPEASYAGIVLALCSFVVMPFLAREKRKVAAQLNSRALEADSKQTDICAYLSAILLGGLLLNALFGFWWADPVAALIMTPIIVKEGVEALRGETCGCDSACH
jgi:divalent metal cation (Fe/Co/Zn/Cd) transporter